MADDRDLRRPARREQEHLLEVVEGLAGLRWQASPAGGCFGAVSKELLVSEFFSRAVVVVEGALVGEANGQEVGGEAVPEHVEESVAVYVPNVFPHPQAKPRLPACQGLGRT